MLDESTTSQIWNEFAAQLRRFIANRIRNDSDTEDLLQEVFIKIHRNIHQLEDQTKLHAWVYQITRNTITDYYRHRETTTSSDSSEIPDHLMQDEPTEEVETEVATWLKPMIEDLSDKYREALLLTDIQGLTQAELAAQLNLSLSGAKSRVQRAREKLKEKMLKCCHLEFDRLGRVVDWESREQECRYCTVQITRK
jgi:RNA polymerase sigma-70 factor, ECF subfamily